MARRRSAAEVRESRAALAERRSALGVEMFDDEFLAGLAAAAERLEIKGVASLQAKALRVQNQARRLCPVDTGRLRASIVASEVQRDSRGHFIEVGSNVAYAMPVEFGTLDSAPQPFMRPALLLVYGGGGGR